MPTHGTGGRVQGNLDRRVYCLLGLPFDALDVAGAVRRVRDGVAQRRRCLISTPNLNFLVNSQNDATFRDSVIASDLSIVDGMPLLWMARLLRLPFPERVPGSGLVEQLRKTGSPTVSVYFFGGPDGIAEQAARRLNAEAGGLVCAGFESPGYGSVEELSREESIARINASGADLLIVSLGAKKGQAWIERNRARISVPAISHLGAVVNLVAGTLRRAPSWMQNAGLEWLWRIKEEPALWRRYLGDGVDLLRLFFGRALPFAWLVRRQKPAPAEFESARLEVVKGSTSVLIRLHGAWGEENLERLRACLSAATAERRNIRINLSGVSYVDSSFLGLLLLLYGMQKGAMRQLLCDGESERVRRIFAYGCSEFLLDGIAVAGTELDELMLEKVQRVQILNATFDALTLSQTVDAVFAHIYSGRRGWLSTVNVAILMMMRKSPHLQNFVNRSALVVADGQPLIWYSRWVGAAMPERVTGVDLIGALCERAAREGKRVFLLGATSAVIHAAAERLRSRWPALQISCADGYFDEAVAEERADRIRDARTDILLVGMGVPRQEKFILEQWGHLGVAMAIGVGGSFDVVAGLRRRAPKWIQKCGLEWMFRLIQEPRRLFVRYLVTNAQFLRLVAMGFLGRDIAAPLPSEDLDLELEIEEARRTGK